MAALAARRFSLDAALEVGGPLQPSMIGSATYRLEARPPVWRSQSFSLERPMPSALSFWAKLGQAVWPELYHPVICHLIDVAAVTQRLWDDVFRSRFRRWTAERLGCNEEDCGRWLAFWSGAHDIGKVSPGFQAQGHTAELQRQLQAAGFHFTLAGKSKPHGVISTVVLNAELVRGDEWPEVDQRMARNVAVAVGGHHGLFPAGWDTICGPLGNEKWAIARHELLAELARVCEVTNAKQPAIANAGDQSAWMIVAGITSVADWIGSNQEFFEPVGNRALLDGSFNVDEYCAHSKNRAKCALEKLGWSRGSSTSDAITFAQLFRFITEPRPLQQRVEEIVVGMSEPGLLIVEAPMGEGKTEAAWYAAALWNRRGGQGAYVALPTMATSNQMFERVGNFLKGDAGGNLMLLHGKAALNDQFEKLKYAAEIHDEQENNTSAVVAESWFASNKKHGLLAPYGVGTIDQALLAVLQTKHVFVRLFGLAGKCVILDEVHAYDAYMTTLMERLLRWLAALGCPVVMLSATLPREKRLKLLRAYAGRDVAEPDQRDYPRITTVSLGGNADVCHIEADPDRARTVQLDWVSEDRVVQELRQALSDGGCAAVIRNTVGLAQSTYVQLRDAFEDDGIAVELFHARFPFGRRQEIENAVLQRFGKDGGPAERNKRVLVATQVVEQSLDLDFDLMVSDLAPVDLVLQRAGRLHRHDRGRRPEGVNESRLWLIEPASKDGLPDFGRSEYVYARFVLLRSLLALRAIEPSAVELPGHLETLIEQVYGDKPLTIPDGWQLAVDDAEREMQEEQKTKRKKAKGLMIYRPNDEDLLRQQNAQLDEENPEAAETIRAATRDTEPTIRVVLVYNIDGRDYLDESGRESLNEADGPDIKRIRRLLDNEVTINHRGCVAFYAGRTVPTSWRERGMLRHHRIVRIDAFGVSLSTEYPLRFDPHIGVIFTRDVEEKESR